VTKFNILFHYNLLSWLQNQCKVPDDLCWLDPGMQPNEVSLSTVEE